MSFISITSVPFATPPAGNTLIFFKYRKVGDTEWTQLNGGLGISVPSNGILLAPLTISGLLPSTQYQISAQAKLCGGAAYLVIVETPTIVCPQILDIGTISSN